jgi:alpha-L-rhamnosidase
VDDLSGASWITLPRPAYVRDGYRPCPTLVRTFALDLVSSTARLHVTALGLFRAFVNGVRVGEDELTPGWTDYRQRVDVWTYDVRSLLRVGDNTLELLLADGWYAGYLGTDHVRARYGEEPAALAALGLDDGVDVVTDETWTGSFGGLLASDLYLGETFDARITPSAPQPVTVLDPQPELRLTPRTGPPVREQQPVAPVSQQEHRAGHLLVDFGVNIAGRVRVTVRGRAGDEITLRHAEMLQEGGRTLYVDNLRHARAADTYVLRGGDAETWQPAFTYHGFRYVELVGISEHTTLESIEAVPLRSDVARRGTFRCSDPRVNALHDAVAQTYANNWVEVPTDCPQRDERLGWTGDAYITATTGSYLYDSTAFYTAWLDNVADALTPDGLYTDVAPAVPPWDKRAAPGWGDGCIVAPWVVHLVSGDTAALQHNLPQMRRWVDAAVAANASLVWESERGEDYGDWLSFDETPKDLFATAILAESAAIVAASLFAVGDVAAGEEYAHLHAGVRAAFVERFGNALTTQTGLVLALRFGLLDGKARTVAAKRLTADVLGRGTRLSTGFFGTEHLLTVLCDNGEADLAYELLLGEELPSWLYFIKHGATTMWEHWDSWTPEAGFKDPFMNSFSHTSLGSVVRFLYETCLGIRPDLTAPGFERVLLTPVPGAGLDWAEGTLAVPSGVVRARWERRDGGVAYAVDLPCPGTLRRKGYADLELAPGRHELAVVGTDP